MIRKISKFDLADGGTLFMDEIGDMTLGMQAKLLRVLEEDMFCRVGGNVPISVDVRVISATNRDIAQEVAEDSFKKEFITLNLNHSGGNRSKGARIMGIQRTYLSRLISKYRLQEI